MPELILAAAVVGLVVIGAALFYGAWSVWVLLIKWDARHD